MTGLRSCRAGGRAFGLALLALGCLGSLSEAQARGLEGASAEQPQAVVETAAPVQIRTGRGLDFEGKPVFENRSSFSGVAAISGSTNVRQPVRIGAGVPSGPAGYPLQRGAVTSGFGLRSDPFGAGRRMHSGIDLAAAAGSPILSTFDGVVSRAGWNGGFGIFVSVEHGGGLQTRYGHMAQVAVTAGQVVRKGDVLGYVGSTGRSTGPHLHYEMRRNGIAVSPILGSRN